jgi:hypothetical protein
MSDFHVLEINDRKDQARIVFHFAIPAGNNNANPAVPFSTAYKQWKEFDGSTLKSVIPNLSTINPTEDQAIKDGTVIEQVAIVEYAATANNAAKLAAIQAKWTELNAIAQTRVQDNLKFWGHAAEVP